MYPGGARASIMRFQTVNELLKYENDTQLANQLKSISCLSISMEARNGDNILELIDMVNRLSVEQKTLDLVIPSADLKLMENKALNFDVIAYHKNRGNITIKNCKILIGDYTKVPLPWLIWPM